MSDAPVHDDLTVDVSDQSVDAVVVGHVDPVALAKATRRAVNRALAEDFGDRGDLTGRATVPADLSGEAEIVARSAGVVSGLAAVVETFAAVDPRIVVEVQVADGDHVIEDQVIAVVSGPMRALLAGERTALNFLGHLSGIATATADLQALLEGTGCVIRDTRKTTPGLRLLEKAAVADGGGNNHRIGLFDAVLVKENHIMAAGGLTEAIERLRRVDPGVNVQVEVEELEQIWRILELGVTDILLDNFTPDQVRVAAQRIDGRAQIEVSGNLTAETVRAYAEAVGPGGRLAVGAITHSAPNLDVAMDVVETERAQRRRLQPATASLVSPAAASDHGFGGRADEPSVEQPAVTSSPEELDAAAPDGEPFAWRQSPFRQRRQRGD